jgi:shikimate kinase
VLARNLGMRFVDVDDDVLEPYWRTSVASKLKQLGDDAFLEAEGEAVLTLDAKSTVISLSGYETCTLQFGMGESLMCS